MKKVAMMLGALLLSASAMAHNQFLFTDTMDASNQKEVKIKTLFSHPAEGKDGGAMNVGTYEGKAMPVKDFFMVHDGQKVSLKDKVLDGTITTDQNSARTLDYTFTPADGLKGKGSFIFVMVPHEATDSGYTFYGAPKLIISKDGDGGDWNKRVADGYPEIIPMKHPVSAWKEDVFVAKFVDKDGKALANARIDIDFINGKVDMMKNVYKGGDPAMPKTSKRTFTDDNGMFYFIAPREGMYAIRAVASMDREKKVVHDTSLLVQFK